MDDSGQKRQQYLYPVAKYPQALYTFFEKMSGVKQVIFDNNGTIEVEGSSLSFRGIMDYAVESGQTATGSIQYKSTFVYTLRVAIFDFKSFHFLPLNN